MPLSGTGISVCECGATRRVEQGKAVEEWHACALCVGKAFLEATNEDPA